MLEKMKKKIRLRVQSECAWLGEIKVRHVLPNKFVQAIGSFVFLEHILSYKQSLNESYTRLVGKRSHPHRGIATLTYILSGEVEHLDSIGNYAKMSSGGAHWMKAGKGVIHEEAVSPECRLTNPDISVVQFWINLPSKHKSEEPDYFCLRPSEIPKQELDNDGGWIKVISGEYGNTIAKVPCYSKEFLYHIHLKAGGKFSIITNMTCEYAAFFPANNAVVNDIGFQAGEFILFTSLGEMIEILNNGKTAIDIILFGGEPYNEPIIVEGTFVMNTPHEITQAYNDYYDGKYGQLSFSKSIYKLKN
jgi:redox-sensitive bicupin YhaK (pirin superfamily)